jgi:hypothetical protein
MSVITLSRGPKDDKGAPTSNTETASEAAQRSGGARETGPGGARSAG